MVLHQMQKLFATIPTFAFGSPTTTTLNFTIKQTGTYNVYLEYIPGNNNTSGYIKIT